MRFIRSTMLAGATAALLSASPALAVTIDFGANNLALTNSITVSQQGYTLTATGHGTDASGNILVDAQVKQTGSLANNEGGFGISTVADGNHEIDGGIGGSNIHRELLLLTFNAPVRIASAAFSRVDADDDVSIFVDGVLKTTKSIGSGWNNFIGADFIGTTFGFAALGQDDNFKLRAIELTPVPLPPAILAMVSGIFGLGVLGRKKRR